ncbi:Hypothetical predicted protein [Pelobates cultripes]|uniref:Uncharacterized protein n=1 Tax=Pelobates cultripes TaxID=61616 RepID=A0AAD1WI17_PELCU|nr:Hypothetical predicted protein [Pelobates cultripes]
MGSQGDARDRGPTSPEAITGGETLNPRPGDPEVIQRYIGDLKTYLTQMISQSTREIKAEIWEVGQRMADLEERVETVVTAHNHMADCTLELHQRILALPVPPEQPPTAGRTGGSW